MNDKAAVRKQLGYLAISAGSSRLGINHQNMRILRIQSMTIICKYIIKILILLSTKFGDLDG